MSLPALPVDPEGSAPTSGQIYAPLTEEDPWLQLRVGVKNKVSNKCNLQVYPSSCSAFILLSVLVSCVFHIIYIIIRTEQYFWLDCEEKLGEENCK